MQNQISALQQDANRLRHDRDDLANKLDRMRDNPHSTVNDARWLVKDARGITLLLDKESLVDLHVFHHDRWEEDRLEYLLNLIGRLLDSNDECYFFDVGSYFGQYSLAIKKQFPRVNVMAFEANPYNFIQLRANLLLNDLIEEITTYNRCVTNIIGRTSVSRPDRDNRGGAAVGAAYHGTAQSTFVVDNLVFDDEFSSICDALLFMKMDIEGSEPNALAGMRDLSARNRMVLQIEDWDFPHSASNSVLEEMGFKLISKMNPEFFYANFDLPDAIIT